MQVKGRSVTSAARRVQIVDATVETIARLGYRQTSFAKIAEQAGISSTRLISYHFAGKDELMGEVAASVLREIGNFMTDRMTGQPDARSALRAYITGVVEFVAGHGSQMHALSEIFLNLRADSGDNPVYDAAADRSVISHVEEILLSGQRAGEFRDFDAFVMAATIQRAVDGLPFLLQSKPDLDLDDYAEELATLFDRATRAAA